MTDYIATLAERPSHGRREDAWKAMRPFWENVDPALIDEQMAKDYRATRAVADATARYELMALSSGLNWAVAAKHLPSRAKVWLPPVPERKTRHLTRSQFRRFRAAMNAPHAKLYALLGVHTMARPTAILELTWDRVDLTRRLIDFSPPGRSQTRKRRTTVPIGDTLLEALRAAWEGRTSTFVVEYAGGQVASVKKAFQAASGRSGVRATPYTLRHTGAVWAAEAGVPMAQLAQFMGHDDDRTTQTHYARYSPDFLRSVVDALEDEPRNSCRGSV